MKVLILSTTDIKGGAAVAANRLTKALKKVGVEVSMLVRDKLSNATEIVSIEESIFQAKLNFLRFVWERIIIFICNSFDRKQLFKVSIANTGVDISKYPLVQEADIIHLHWINQGFLSLSDIKKLVELGKPIVWTLHDMWPITAICHHSLGCDLFMKECGKCPLLNSYNPKDLSYRIFQKKRFISHSDIHLVVVSNWLKQQVLKSTLGKGLAISVIPNVIDINVFSPKEKKEVRDKLLLPLDKKIILLGAARINDPIKGFDLLLRSLSLITNKDKYLLVLFGGIKGDTSFLSRMPIPCRWMGVLSDPHKIAELYSAADVTVVSSLYETFGQTIIEGMACGCPAVSFNNSGQTDIIDHLKDGYLAKYQDCEDLAHGIEWVIENNRLGKLSELCIQKVHENYEESVIAEKYLYLYESLLKSNKA